MNAEQENLLQVKKEQYKLKQKEIAIQESINNVVQNVESFNKKYRFVNDWDKNRLFFSLYLY